MERHLGVQPGDKQQESGISPWLGILAIVLVAMDLRPGIVSVGPVLNSIRETFGLSHAMASLLTAIPDLLMGSLALPTPWLAKRFGRDKSILAALVLLCISTILRSFSTSTSGLLLTTIGVGAGIAIAGALVAGFIKANFASRAALIMGVYATSLSWKHDFSRSHWAIGRREPSRMEIRNRCLECPGAFSNDFVGDCCDPGAEGSEASSANQADHSIAVV